MGSCLSLLNVQVQAYHSASQLLTPLSSSMTLITLHRIHHTLHTGLASSSSSACQTPAQNHRTSACALFSTQNVLDLPMDEMAWTRFSLNLIYFPKPPRRNHPIRDCPHQPPDPEQPHEQSSFRSEILAIRWTSFSFTHYLSACPSRIQFHPLWWNTLSGSLLSLMNQVYYRSLVSTLFSNQWQEPSC